MRDIEVLKCGYERFCGMFLFIQGENNDTKHENAQDLIAEDLNIYM